MQDSNTGRDVSLPLSPEAVSSITRALAEPRRLAILQQVAAGSSTLCGALDVRGCLSAATISHHLKELQTAGLVQVEREGRVMRLSLRRDVWDAYLQQLAHLL